MIKNLNDVFSILVLIFLVIYSIRILMWSFIEEKDDIDKNISRWKLIKEYLDNEEE